MKIIVLGLLITCIASCMESAEISKNLDIQGHRGCRGLIPENTIPGFLRAIDIGVNTLELDLVITGDHQVLISHDPYFNHYISTGPDATNINSSNELSHNIYKLTYDEVKQYDVGLKPYPSFPLQKKIPIHKPLLSDMVKAVENYESFHFGPIFYNMEIKWKAKWNETYHPSRDTFAALVVREIESLGIKDRTTIQCFDAETLRIVRKMDPSIRLIYLVENLFPFEANLSSLGFTPFAYSPDYRLVTPALISHCKEHNIKVIPWTVNDDKEIEEIIKKGVDGLISDYPDRVVEIYQSLKPKVDARH